MSERKQQQSKEERRPRPRMPLQPPHRHPPLQCPRCGSNETKFCYYNNYTQTQPRYVCKTCKRYWTHGGSLRNVPVGGGSRKRNNEDKKALTSSLSTVIAASELAPQLQMAGTNKSAVVVAGGMVSPGPAPNAFPALLGVPGMGGIIGSALIGGNNGCLLPNPMMVPTVFNPPPMYGINMHQQQMQQRPQLVGGLAADGIGPGGQPPPLNRNMMASRGSTPLNAAVFTGSAATPSTTVTVTWGGISDEFQGADAASGGGAADEEWAGVISGGNLPPPLPPPFM